MEAEWILLSKLKKDPENANTHTPEQIEIVARSFLRFGMLKNIAADKKTKTVKAGNGAMEAVEWVAANAHDPEIREIAIARQLLTPKGKKLVPQILCKLVDFSSPEEAKAFALVDNQSNRMAGFDFFTVAEQLRELNGKGIEVGSLGWTEFEWNAITSNFWRTNEEVTEPEYGNVDFRNQQGGGITNVPEDKTPSSFRSIQIEFRPEEYSEALDLLKLLRHRSIHIGGVVLEALQRKSEQIHEIENRQDQRD